jgi:hypothetical protein
VVKNWTCKDIPISASAFALLNAHPGKHNTDKIKKDKKIINSFI